VDVNGRASSPRGKPAGLPGDEPEQMIAGIEAYERAGVDHIVLALNSEIWRTSPR
jgi:hypothetical protein